MKMVQTRQYQDAKGMDNVKEDNVQNSTLLGKIRLKRTVEEQEEMDKDEKNKDRNK
jgi:hypothetical protein